MEEVEQLTEHQRQQQLNALAKQFEDKPGATPFYLLAKGDEQGPLDFGTHFNPKLVEHTTYYARLNDMMKCAQRNADAVNKETVCAKEFKSLRMAAFRDELLYHHVNKRFFMNELAVKKGESPYWRESKKERD